VPERFGKWNAIYRNFDRWAKDGVWARVLERVQALADKGYPPKANRAWLRQHGIAATIPERDDQIAHRRRKPGRPIDFGPLQQERYRGRNVVERCFNRLKQWRGIVMRSEKIAPYLPLINTLTKLPDGLLVSISAGS
jgi:transposase